MTGDSVLDESVMEYAAGPAEVSASPISQARWTQLVARIREGNQAGLTELYNLFSKGIRFQFCRQLGPQDLDDRVHDTFLVIVQAIRAGELRDPERLLGFIRTVVRRHVAAHIDHRIHNRREQVDLECGVTVPDSHPDPESRVINDQHVQFMKGVLDDLNEKDREVLVLFYLKEQTQDEICEAMLLSETQFRLLKSRAKQRFSDLGRRKAKIRSLTQFFVRRIEPFSH